MGTLKDRLDEVVADRKMTTREARAELAKLGMTRSNLSHWFGGRAVEPRATTLAPVADFFGVNAVWLASGKGPKRPGGEGNKVSAKLLRLSQEAVDIATAYEAMDPHVQEMIRRHMRDLNEALGSPSPTNPFGKGKRKPTKKAAAKKKKYQPGTQ